MNTTLSTVLITSNMLTEDVEPETKDCNHGRFGSDSSGCLNWRLWARKTNGYLPLDRMRPISRDTNMYALGSCDSAVLSQLVRDNSTAPRYRESPALPQIHAVATCINAWLGLLIN